MKDFLLESLIGHDTVAEKLNQSSLTPLICIDLQKDQNQAHASPRSFRASYSPTKK